MTEITFLTLVGTGGIFFALFCLGLVFLTIIGLETLLKFVGLIPSEESSERVLDIFEDMS